MKFMYHLLPAFPAASLEERERLAPIAHRTDKTQEMLDEMLAVAQFAEEVGFDIVTFSEHHFYTEGLEAGAAPTPHLIRLLLNTKRIKIGPLGFVLPTWDPIRLAEEVAWADQMSKGRVVVGLARGVFPRWVNVLGQHYLTQPSVMGPEADEHNREVFEELFEVVKLAWKDEPFSFKGRFYQVPYPAEGYNWPPYEATRRLGAPGELEGQNLRKISPVPKPFQKPHPPIFQAFTTSEKTIRYTARHAIIPTVFRPFPDLAIEAFDAYAEEANKFGYNFKRGQNAGFCSFFYIGKDHDDALRLMRDGSFYLYKNFHAKVDPNIPTTNEQFLNAGVAVAGTVDDVRRRMAEVKEKLDPEYQLWIGDQGFLPLDDIKRQLERFATKVMPEFR
jgi:alkanesulfonate monooxygenase SsuD/methylene tetrahydromethanopterin reductase-like flavin-dependent oxidoreductase (luciferase family)